MLWPHRCWQTRSPDSPVGTFAIIVRFHLIQHMGTYVVAILSGREITTL